MYPWSVLVQIPHRSVRSRVAIELGTDPWGLSALRKNALAAATSVSLRGRPPFGIFRFEEGFHL